jgi:hypothetical protein
LATDFLEALTEWWGSNAAIGAAGLSTLHFGTAPGNDYPYAVATKSGGNVSHRNFTKTSIDVDVWRIAITSNDPDQAFRLGSVATTALDTLLDNPLVFDDGVLLVLERSGENMVKLRHSGTGGAPFVWLFSITLKSKIQRIRP